MEKDAASQINWLTMVLHGGPSGIFIMLLLVTASLWVWALILAKMRGMKKVEKLSGRFLVSFWESKSLSDLNNHIKNIPYSPAREIFRSGFNEMIRVLQAREKKNINTAINFDTVKRALFRQKVIEEALLSKNINLLAICASAAPFVGLFGTVIGIIRAFHDIGSSGASSLAAVAPGISEALIATALGLFVAIPAVIFYNLFLAKVKKHLILLDSFAADFINILERHYSMPGGTSHNQSEETHG